MLRTLPHAWDKEHWEAVGYLHDYDYEKYPEEHLAHTEEPLRAEGVPEEDIRAILSHGYSICTDVEPISDMEKSLFTVDELSGIVQAAARMRPNGIVDMSLKSFMKKWKDKRFAAGCNREIILKGCGAECWAWISGMWLRSASGVCRSMLRSWGWRAREKRYVGPRSILRYMPLKNPLLAENPRIKGQAHTYSPRGYGIPFTEPFTGGKSANKGKERGVCSNFLTEN